MVEEGSFSSFHAVEVSKKKKSYKFTSEVWCTFKVGDRCFPCKGVEWCLTNSKLSMLLLFFIWYFYGSFCGARIGEFLTGSFILYISSLFVVQKFVWF